MYIELTLRVTQFSDVPSVSNDDDNDAGFQDDGGNGENIDSDSDVEIIAQTSNHGMSTSTQSQNPVVCAQCC